MTNALALTLPVSKAWISVPADKSADTPPVIMPDW
jgi:hypothetical protein